MPAPRFKPDAKKAYLLQIMRQISPKGLTEDNLVWFVKDTFGIGNKSAKALVRSLVREHLLLVRKVPMFYITNQ